MNAKHKGLGKGLRALIPAYQEETDRYMDGAIPLSQIIPNRNQPRQKFASDAMDELINSIRENGILQPLTVREIGKDQFELIAGERRDRAAVELGLSTVPVYVISVDTDVEMLEYALVENVQREDLDPIEEAEGYALLSSKYNLRQEDIAHKVGKNRTTITNSLRLLKLPVEIKTSLKSGEISQGHARALLALKSATSMINLHQRIITNQLNVRQVEELVKAMSNPAGTVKKKSPKIRKKSTAILGFEKDVRDTLGTKVAINRNKTGRGKIEIEFYSDDDLDRLIEIITKS